MAIESLSLARTAMPTPEHLMDEARRKTGLSNFGPDTFRAGLDAFLEAIRDADLPERNTKVLLDLTLQRLVNRLEVEETLRLNPEILSQPIVGPLSITGLPRTGTTALVHIMSQEEGMRNPRAWEQEKPCPPPVLATEKEDPRRVAAVQRIERFVRENPDQAAMHIYDADSAEEDLEILGLEFKSQQLALPSFAYHKWWRETELFTTFAYHRRVLQLLQWHRPPNRWLLKSPAHCFHLEAIVAAYPDARFVMTHRDPGKSVPSALSLMSSLLPPGKQNETFLTKFGRTHAEHLRIGIERSIESRKRIGEHRFLDVYHRDFSRAPFQELQRIYDFVGFEFRPHVREIMERWHAKNHTGAHGVHRYTAEQFGLSADQIRSDYDVYIRRFNVPIESKGN